MMMTMALVFGTVIGSSYGDGRVTELSRYPEGSVVAVTRHQWRSDVNNRSLEFSSDDEKAFWCKLWWALVDRNKNLAGKRWSRICRGKGELEERAQRWSTCVVDRFVARIQQGQVTLSRSPQGPPGNALVSNKTHSFPLHLNDLKRSQDGAKIRRFTGPIAHSFGSLSLSTAHLINQIHRLVTVARNVPPRTIILTLDTRLHREFVKLFQSRRVVPDDVSFEFISPAKQKGTQIFTAPSVYFAGEAVAVDNDYLPALSPTHRWYTLEKEICSWQLASNRSEIRHLLDRHEAPDTASSFEALVVSREDATSRSVRNHKGLVSTVREALSEASRQVNVRVFVGRNHNVESTELFWRRADLVVAPHGAALAFMLFMRPGTHVIELGYHVGGSGPRRNYDLAALGGSKGMPWPAPYYWVIAVSSNVNLYASMSSGSYGGAMTANLTDVAQLIRKRILPGLDSSR